MPRYEYRCEANGRTVEVAHAMSERLATWGELCERAGIDPGPTAPSTPIERLISLSAISTGARSSGGPSTWSAGGSCGPGCGCHP